MRTLHRAAPVWHCVQNRTDATVESQAKCLQFLGTANARLPDLLGPDGRIKNRMDLVCENDEAAKNWAKAQ